MSKKNNKKRLNEFDGYALAFWLAQKCNQRDKHSNKATDGSYNRTIKQDTLAEVLATETTLVNQYATLVGYLKVVFKLFYITFIRKKSNGSVPILRGAFFVQQ